MKILFTADWHINLRKRHVPKEFQVDRYRKLFDELAKIECDTMVLGGDIFDKIPP